MAVPIYDNTLPCIGYPFENIHSASKRYLGNTALTGKVYATLSITCRDDDEMMALHTFWREACNYGVNPFVLPAPMFGMPIDTVSFYAQWVGDFKPTKIDTHWTMKLKVKILAPLFFVTDDDGEYITNDDGLYIFSGNSLHPSCDNIIAYVTVADIVV